MDRAKGVRLLISSAFDAIYDWPEPDDGAGAMVARLGSGGAGI